jgi:hypothetical protein
VSVLGEYGALLTVAVAAVLFLSALIVIRRGADASTNPRPARVLGVVFSLLAGIILAVLALVDPPDRWLWVLALAPGAFVVHHAIHLAVFKNRRFFDTPGTAEYAPESVKLIPLMKAAEAQERRYYSTPSLMLRFAVPAIVLTIACLTVGRITSTVPEDWIASLDRRFLMGTQFGALGAYIYIVLFLGGRASRGDLTPGSVVWSIVTILVGPLLAGSLQVLAIDASSDAWTAYLLPFAAGFSLRFIVAFVEVTIRRVFGGTAEVTAPRLALMSLRGVSREIEERFAEEGITDVAMLARANPHRLRRNMALDKRQITSWIDEAILTVSLPAAWQALVLDGIGGASQLVWYLDGVGVTTDIPDRIKALATRNKLDEQMLFEVIQRLARDSQVLLVQALYELDDQEAAEDGWQFRNFRAEAAEQPEADTGVDERAPLVAPMTNRAVFDVPNADPATSDLEVLRVRRYGDTHGLFISHTWRRSRRQGQKADVMIRVVQHRHGPLTEGRVKRVEYQLGPKFSVTPIEKSDARDGFALAVSTHGPVLCVARVAFTDNTAPIILERYVDFAFDEEPAPNAA